MRVGRRKRGGRGVLHVCNTSPACAKAAISWMDANQFGRRNLSPYERTKLALRLEEAIAGRAKAKQKESGGSVLQKSEKPPIHTSEELAKLAGVSRDTVDKVKQDHDPQDGRHPAPGRAPGTLPADSGTIRF